MQPTRTPPGLALVILVIITACGSTAEVDTASPGGSSGAAEPVVLEDLTRAGGCANTAHASNDGWTQVVQVRIVDPTAIEPSAPTALTIGAGVSVRLTQGVKLQNLFCNDYLEGDERIDLDLRAIAGTVTVTLDDDFPDESAGRSNGVGTSVELEAIEFEDGAQLESLTIDTTIGWLPG